MKVHQIKINFNVTPEIARYVYVYLIEAQNIYMIDSGVAGSERQIEEYLTSIGRETSDIKAIFLTHAHPDHIGTAAYFKQKTSCKVYASEGERPWIEDIDVQFKERPIPNFYSLAGHSCKIDCVIKDGDCITLEEGLTVKTFSTPGHSCDEMSYIVGSHAFIGDAIPVKGDIPIYISKDKSMASVERIKSLADIDTFCPAWDYIYTKEELDIKYMEAFEIIQMLDKVVRSINVPLSIDELTIKVCEIINKPMFMASPLFKRTIQCHA